jgi:hypothetical protein
VRHKKTFFHLEQMIIKHNAHQNTIKITNVAGALLLMLSSPPSQAHLRTAAVASPS